MAGYEYANARLHAMKARLLGREHYRALAEAASLERLLAALTHTPYREAIEATLIRVSELEALNAALSADLCATARRIRRFFDGPEGRALALVLQYYDIHNLKALLRGLHSRASQAEIRAAQLPVGDLSEAILDELAEAADLRAALDLMASLRLPQASPLLAARSAQPGAQLPELELALDRWYFAGALAEAAEGPPETSLLRDALAMEADLVNLLTVTRLTASPAERSAYLQRYRAGSVTDLFVGPGRLPFAELEGAATQVSLAAAVHVLAGTPYGEPLAAGLDAFGRSGRLSDIERHLRRHRLRWRAGLVARDPLGIGVVLGYLALKVNEVENLRRVVYGVSAGLPPGTILEELELVG